MFDIGFSELLLFGVIALIVLGPEKLPQAARTAGQWYAKIRRTVSTLQSEIEAELDLAETRQQMQKELAKIRQTEADMKREMAEMRGNMKAFANSQNSSISQNGSSIPPQNSAPEDSNPPTIPNAADQSVTSHAHQVEPANNPLSKQNVSDSLDTDSKVDSKVNRDIERMAQTMSTRPWENMWFRLGDYDKARRLPMPPYLPNYKADKLLNHAVDIQASVSKQEAN